MAGDTPRLARAAQEGTGRPVEWLAGVEPARGAGRWSTSAAKKKSGDADAPPYRTEGTLPVDWMRNKRTAPLTQK